MLHDYQRKIVDFIKEKKKVGIWADLGLGKTLSTLTAIHEIQPKSLLIIAPLRVANTTWNEEALKWGFDSIAIATGTPSQRLEALKTKNKRIVINRENVEWLIEQKIKFDMIVVDESSSFKSRDTKRFEALKIIANLARYVVLLSATPAPNGPMDLWSQIYLLDKGQRLGKDITTYRRRYFYQDSWNKHKYIPHEFSNKLISEKLNDITISLKATDYLNMVDKTNIIEKIILPKMAMNQYKELKKELVLELEKETIIAPTIATLTSKLFQLSNGFIYNEEKIARDLHDEKIEALKELEGENMIVAYWFKHDLVKLKKAFPNAKEINEKNKKLWNEGKIKMLLTHPASAGYGLNLQQGGSVLIWYSLTWSLELYQQMIGRIYRQGQTKAVRIVHLVAKDTIDERIVEVLNNKDYTQMTLLNLVKMVCCV